MPVLHETVSCVGLFPRYVGEFRCIGAHCENSCCSGWDISLDPKTSAAYIDPARLGLPALTKRLENRIRFHAPAGSADKQACMINDTGSDDCPALEQGWCAIQRDFGADKLANTCFDYPRYTRRFLGNIEQVLTMSCPEAARLALLQADAFDFAEGDLVLRPESVGEIKEKWGISSDDMNEIRIFCIQLMRSEGLQIWEKLVILGAFCRELDRVIASENSSGFGQLLDNFLILSEHGEFAKMLAKIQGDPVFQAKLFHTVWQTRREQPRSSGRQRVQDAVALALGTDRQTGLLDPELLVENYRLGLQNIPGALAATPFLLEHYVLNEMFRDCFPFAASSAYQNYLGIVFRFGMLRFMLAALCADSRSLPDRDELITVVGVFCRIYQYDSLAALFNQALQEVGWNSLEDVYRLLPG